MNKLTKFLSLNSEEKSVFVEAYVTLGLMRAALLIMPFKKLTKHLRHSENFEEQYQPSPQTLARAAGIGKIIQKAAYHTPWESACLVQSLTAQRILHKRGIAGAFCLGAAKDDNCVEKMKAHAWSICGEQIITGEAGHEDYTLLSVFAWGNEP